MTKKISRLLSLRNQLLQIDQALIVSHAQLNQAVANLEDATASCAHMVRQHPLYGMAHEHLLQSGAALLQINQSISRVQHEIEVNQTHAERDAETLVEIMSQIKRIQAHYLKHIGDNKIWLNGIREIEQIIKHASELSASYKKQLNLLFSDLIIKKNERKGKIDQFQEQLHLLYEKSERASHAPKYLEIQKALQEQLNVLLEKKALQVREIQRYQHIIDNIEATAQAQTVVPIRFHRDRVRNVLAKLHNKQAAIQHEIKLLLHPEKSVNDLWIDFDERPRANSNRYKRQ